MKGFDENFQAFLQTWQAAQDAGTVELGEYSPFEPIQTKEQHRLALQLLKFLQAKDSSASKIALLESHIEDFVAKQKS